MSKEAIRSALVNKLVNSDITEPVQWPNAPFDVPNAELWIRFSPMFANDSMVTLNDSDEQPVILQIDIFAPKATGEMPAFQIADKIQALYSKKSRISFAGGYMQVMGFSATPSAGDTYYRVMCEIDINAYLERI